MEKKFLLNNGVSLPAPGLGTWQMTGKVCEKAVIWALDVGYRHIDTAALYGNETEIGNAIRASKIPREELFVTTKLWNSDHANPQKAFEESLKRLGLEYVDLYLIHWPVPQRIATWNVLEKLLESGNCKAMGVSNFTIRHLEELLTASTVVPTVNQVEFTPFVYQKELLDFCKKNRIVLESYSPLTRGNNLDDAILQQLAEKYGKSAAQIILRWNIQHGVVPLPKSKTPERIKENFDIFDFTISSHDMRKIDKLDRNLRYCWDPNTMA